MSLVSTIMQRITQVSSYSPITLIISFNFSEKVSYEDYLSTVLPVMSEAKLFPMGVLGKSNLTFSSSKMLLSDSLDGFIFYRVLHEKYKPEACFGTAVARKKPIFHRQTLG